MLKWLTALFKQQEIPLNVFSNTKCSSCSTPNWLTIALKDIGVFEISGELHNRRILEFHQNTTLKATTDEIPWCASAVSTWLTEAGLPSTNSAIARAYIIYGVGLAAPKLGCIAVFWRESIDSTKGHVGLYIGEVGDQILILGGNQGNAVTISLYPKKRLLAYRWPKGVDDGNTNS